MARSDRLMVVSAFVLGALFLGAAVLTWRYTREEARIAAALADHGAITEGRWVRSTHVVSDNRKEKTSGPRPGRDVGVARHRIYAYSVGGRGYEMKDRGESILSPTYDPQAPEAQRPMPGQPVLAEIVYLPEAPATARLRRELEPETRTMTLIAGALLAAGIVLLGFGLRLVFGPSRS